MIRVNQIDKRERLRECFSHLNDLSPGPKARREYYHGWSIQNEEKYLQGHGEERRERVGDFREDWGHEGSGTSRARLGAESRSVCKALQGCSRDRNDCEELLYQGLDCRYSGQREEPNCSRELDRSELGQVFEGVQTVPRQSEEEQGGESSERVGYDYRGIDGHAQEECEVRVGVTKVSPREERFFSGGFFWLNNTLGHMAP